MTFYTSAYPTPGTQPTAEQLRLRPVVAKTGEMDALLDAVEKLMNHHVAGWRRPGAA